MLGWCGAESRSAVSDRHGALSAQGGRAHGQVRDRDLELAKPRAAAEVAAAEPVAELEAVTSARPPQRTRARPSNRDRKKPASRLRLQGGRVEDEEASLYIFGV